MRTNTLSARPPIDKKLIDKYTLRGPRYTSYPTAPVWSEDVGEAAYRSHIHETNQPGNQTPLSIYIHVPFCDERCSYCACNVIITPHKHISEEYVGYVNREIDLVAPDISTERNVDQFHLGGGTPTHLLPEALDKMLSHVDARFQYTSDPERSIEVDPRVTTADHLDVLIAHGFNRISIGVEDFFEATQIAINRVQEIDQTKSFVALCREKGFKSVNVDLVYGLPHQTKATFEDTVDVICETDPDRIALYNYAHLPDKVSNQRTIEESWLPDNETRYAIFKTAIERFTAHGLAYIGMDHFAKPNDELTLARQEGHLQRNFMGFTTRAGADLYSFGTSAISNLPALYIQNVKKLNRYKQAIDENNLPIERGVEMSEDDRIRRWVIMELMCNLCVPMERFEALWGHDFHQYFEPEIKRLQPFIDDGLIEPNIAKHIEVTDVGQIIVRPIAMVFDYYLSKAKQPGEKQPTFSKTL